MKRRAEKALLRDSNAVINARESLFDSLRSPPQRITKDPVKSKHAKAMRKDKAFYKVRVKEEGL